MNVKPARTIDLEHRAAYLRDAPRQSLCVAASLNGAVSLVDLDSGLRSTIAGPPGIRDISPHPSEPRLAFVHGPSGRLTIVDFEGRRLAELESPPARPGFPKSLGAGFHGCFFAEDGEHLWCAAGLSLREVELQLRETEDWSVVDTTVVTDPFVGSTSVFSPAGNPERVALWLAAGQDGQQIYWLTNRRGSISCALEPCLRNTTPPAFAPRGDEFLAIDGYPRAVGKYSFPDVRRVAGCAWPWDDDDGFGVSLCYLDDAHAVADSNNGRIFLIDVRSMTIADEVSVEGHEPRPVPGSDPGEFVDEAFCTDLSYFERLRGAIVFAHRRHVTMRPDGEEDTLVCCPVDSFLGP